jgi:hypothetical protein
MSLAVVALLVVVAGAAERVGPRIRHLASATLGRAGVLVLRG